MMTINELENKLSGLFTQRHTEGEDGFVERVDGGRLTVSEKAKTGEFEVHFTYDRFLRIDADSLEFDKKLSSAFKHGLDESISGKCDGVFLLQLNRKIKLVLVELKKRIRRKKFTNGLKQIEGSYLKTLMLLSLLLGSETVKEIEPVAFICGDLSEGREIPFNAKNTIFDGDYENADVRLMRLARDRKIWLDLPYKGYEFFHDGYVKKKIPLFHLEKYQTCDIKTLLK